MASATTSSLPAVDDGPTPSGSSQGEDDVKVVRFGLQSELVVPLAAAVFGLAAAISGQQPTGNGLADLLLPFCFGAGVVLASRFASAQALLISAVLALFFSGFQMPAVFSGLVAVASVVFITSWRRFDADSHAIGAAVGAGFVVQAVLNLPSIGFFGSASLLAVVAVAPIVVSAVIRMPVALRRRTIITSIALAVISAIATVLAIVAALGVRDHVEVGIEQAEDGVAALEAADQPQALALLEASQANFAQASDQLGGPLTWPARWVPIAAQHVRALETAADQGAALARTAARTANQADVERIRGQNGQIDVELIAAVNGELDLANRTVRAAQDALGAVDSGWIVPQLSSRLDTVQLELGETGADIDLANHATSVMPGILGADGMRRYLVLFVQPAESREFGGFVGAYGVLEVDQGTFSLVESGSIDVDLGPGEARFTDPAEFPRSFTSAIPDINPQNITATADLPTIAAAAQDLVPQLREDPTFTIDGVIAMDPFALAGLLELAGPLSIDGRDEPLTSENIVDFLLREQYIEFGEDDRDVRQDVLRVLVGQAFDQLFTVDIPGPERLGAIFGPVARANRLSFATFDEAENQFLGRIFLSADFPQVGSAVEMLGIYGQTGTASKLDAYAHRTSTYEVTVNPETGEVSGLLEIAEFNDAPLEADDFVLGSPGTLGPSGDVLARGSNFLSFGLYTRSSVDSLTATSDFELRETVAAFSYDRHSIQLEVPIGETETISMTTSSVVEPGRYDLFIPAQATANPAEFTLIVRPSPGWVVQREGAASDGSWQQTFVLDEARGFTFFFEPAE